jgi:peptide-methionine (S)-S-oxide reductase
VEVRRLATAATTRIDNYFSNDAYSLIKWSREMNPFRPTDDIRRASSPLLLVVTLLLMTGCYTAEPQRPAQVPTAEPEQPAVAVLDANETPEDRPVDIELPPASEAVPITAVQTSDPALLQTLTVAGGCFWCTEAVFELIDGVQNVESGYCNGQVPNPTYTEVCSGRTGHAEAIRMKFDPSVVSYEDLLHVFFKSHDPTTLNRQGVDVGTQYRSGIYFHNEQQKKQAEAVIAEFDASGEFSRPIVTEVVPAAKFYSAEDEHQDYFELNGRRPYCRRVVQPKVDKVRRIFSDKLRS